MIGAKTRNVHKPPLNHNHLKHLWTNPIPGGLAAEAAAVAPESEVKFPRIGRRTGRFAELRLDVSGDLGELFGVILREY